LAREIGQMAGGIGTSRSGPISVELKGPGGGGLPYANFYDAVSSIYYREWIIPEGATESPVTTLAEVTIARDGTVVSASIIRSSGNAVVDQSVRMTLDRVRKVSPLPANAEKDTETIRLKFNPIPESKRS
jgi:TonB family protein